MPKAQSMVVKGGLCCNPSLSRFIKYLMGAIAREPTGGILG